MSDNKSVSDNESKSYFPDGGYQYAGCCQQTILIQLCHPSSHPASLSLMSNCPLSNVPPTCHILCCILRGNLLHYFLNLAPHKSPSTSILSPHIFQQIQIWLNLTNQHLVFTYILLRIVKWTPSIETDLFLFLAYKPSFSPLIFPQQ